VPRFRSQRTIALLGYLVAERRTITRDRLATFFWPDELPEKGKANLRRELHNLSQILPGCWEIDRVQVRFVASAETTVDLDTIKHYEETEAWESAAELLRGDFLEGVALDDDLEFESWLSGERERWRQRAEHILNHASDQLESQGAYRRALLHARRLLQLMPWHEETHRRVMRLLALSGQRSTALKQYATCQQIVWDELGVDVAAETTALYERIKRTPHFSLDNIPAVTTPLIGREYELEAIATRLADPNVRLVTITGLGGMGKTRLALAAARRHTAGQFRDGVTFVPLAALDSAEQIVPAIAQAYHLPLSAEDRRSARQQLLDFLKTKQTLLVLDNCEHLLDDMTIVAEMLQTAAQLRIVATSRERLRLRNEHLFSLRGLVHDDSEYNPAAQLFVVAAQRVVPEFSLTNENVEFIDRICDLVDGMPLALELAAAWIDNLPLATIIDEVVDDFDFLATDLHDMPHRHRSMRLVLEASLHRLSPVAQQIFAVLSVFRGSFTREAAIEIAAASPRLLAQLVSSSLVKFDQENSRYQLHTLVRQFGKERLAEQPALEHTAEKEHCSYYNELARKGGRALYGGDQLSWVARLRQENDNIRQAIDWAVEHDLEMATQLTCSLYVYWHSSGLIQEGEAYYNRIRPYLDQLSARSQAWLLAAYTAMLWPQGRFEETQALASGTLQLFSELKDEAGISLSYIHLTIVAVHLHGDLEGAMHLAQKGLQHALTPKTNSFFASVLLQSLGMNSMRLGAYDEAQTWLKQGYALCIEREDLSTGNYFLHILAEIAFEQSHYSEARQLVRQFLDAARELGLVSTEIIALYQLGRIAFAENELEIAIQYLKNGVSLAEEGNQQLMLVDLSMGIGDVLLARGVLIEATQSYFEALLMSHEMAYQEGYITSIERLADATWQAGKCRMESVRWLSSVSAWRQQAGLPLSSHDQARHDNLRIDMKTQLGNALFSQLWSESEVLSMADVLPNVMSTCQPLQSSKPFSNT
jgi:predicted ATPase/DNA-binding SARP family transcriptional activator